MKVRSSGKFMDVIDMKVSDEDAVLSRKMTIKTTNTILNERIPINRNTGAPFHPERIIAVREEPKLHLEFSQRGATDGMRTLWNFTSTLSRRSFRN